MLTGGSVDMNDDLALTAARLWADSMMNDVPPERQVAMVTRDEYREMLVLAFARGFVSGWNCRDDGVTLH